MDGFRCMDKPIGRLGGHGGMEGGRTMCQIINGSLICSVLKTSIIIVGPAANLQLVNIVGLICYFNVLHQFFLCQFGTRHFSE